MPRSPTLQWLSLVGIIWLQTISGTNTNFPNYSSQLKSLLSISQLQLNNLAFASDAGKLFGWVSGIATVHLPLWLVLMYGAALGMVGYGFQYVFLVTKMPSLSYWHIFLLTSLAGNSISWINTVSYAITIRNFHAFDRQIAVGLSTSFVGLSPKVYTDIVDAVSPDGSPDERAKLYLLLNSIVPLCVALVTAPLCRDVQMTRTKGLETGFIVMFVITILTGIYAVVSTLGLFSMFSPLVTLTCLGVLLSTPLVIPLGLKLREGLEGRKWVRVHDITIDEWEYEEDAAIGPKQLGGLEGDIYGVKPMEEIGFKLMLRSLKFWLYFFAYMFGATLGMVYLNNLGQIAESRGNSKTSSLVSLCSLFGFFGRLLPSLLNYFFPNNKFMASKPACIATLMTPMAGAFFLLLHQNDIPLYLSTATIGVCTGAISSMAVSTTTELFGTKNFSINHNIVVANIPLGSFIFGYLAAMVYEREGHKDNGRLSCTGANCYRMTFILWGSICSFGTLLCCILYLRTRKFYLNTVLARSNTNSSYV